MTSSAPPAMANSFEWPKFVLWFKPFQMDRYRAWRQVAIATTERAAWAGVRPEQGEWLVLVEGEEP